MPYDLFISYSRRDNLDGRVTELVDRIRQDFPRYAGRELNPFFDRSSIMGMQDWRQRIFQGLRESRLFLACLSPTFIESDHCEWEFVEYQKREIASAHGAEGVAPIYFVQVPGWDDKGFERRAKEWVAELRRKQHFDLRPWAAEGEAALHDEAVRERMEALNRRLATIIQQGERAEKCLGNVDAHNPHFIGRVSSLRALRDNFVKPETIGVLTAVNGVGGLGKTALAIEYAHAYAHEYGGGRWQVRCAGQDDLRLALAQLATPIGFDFTDDEKKSPDRMLDRVRAELKQLADEHEPHRCLLILDNVDRPELLAPAMVKRLNCGDWLHVAATTRLGENELSGKSPDRRFLAIDELPPAEALALIEEYQPNGAFPSEAEREAASGIVKLLGGFTLAIEAAAVYLGKYAGEVTCEGFLELLKRKGLEELDKQAMASGEQVLHGEISLSATLAPTLERLKPAERLALEFAARLPADQVPLPWLRMLVSKTFPELEYEAEPGLPDPWLNLVRALRSQQLVLPTDLLDSLRQLLIVRIHRVVQSTTKDVLRQFSGQHEIESIVLSRVNELSGSPLIEEQWWELQPLLLVADEWARAGNPHADTLFTQLKNCLASLYLPAQEAGGRPGGEMMLRRILAVSEQVFGSDRAALSSSLENAASFFTGEGQSDEVEGRLRRELNDEVRASGPNHPQVARLMNDLASLLHSSNRFAEAEGLYREALRIDELTYGGSHPICARDLNNLAQLFQDTNRLEQAEQLSRRALTLDENSLGPENPRVARDLNNLASLLQATNRPGEAEPLIRRALAIDEASYGPDHPNIAAALNNLAQLLQATNRLAEAEPLMRRALAIDEKSYGPEHPNVATDLNNLARLFQATNRLAEAEPSMRRALAITEGTLGPDHPAVATALNNLASLLQNTTRLAEAEPLMRRSLEISARSLGENHPNVASALNNLASLLQATNRLAEAEPLMRRALAIDEQSYGPEHPLVAIRFRNLASLLYATNRLVEAEPLMRRALAIDEQSYGPEHPKVAIALSNFAQLLYATNRLAEAEPLMRRALAIDEKSYGPEHPDVARDLNNLAKLLQATNRLAEAEPLMRRHLEIFINFTRATGQPHPHLQDAVNNCAGLLMEMGRSQEQVLATLREMAPELFP